MLQKKKPTTPQTELYNNTFKESEKKMKVLLFCKCARNCDIILFCAIKKHMRNLYLLETSEKREG